MFQTQAVTFYSTPQCSHCKCCTSYGNSICLSDPFPLKCWLQVTYPLLKAASFDTFCLVAPQP